MTLLRSISGRIGWSSGRRSDKSSEWSMPANAYIVVLRPGGLLMLNNRLGARERAMTDNTIMLTLK